MTKEEGRGGEKEERMNPVRGIINSLVVDSPLPSNLTYLWGFGSILGLALVIQILTGVFLAMHYVADTTLAFLSVEHIMRDTVNGWILRYAHANGAGMFFIIVYIHMARGLYYGSYRAPRVMLWSVGVIIFLLMMGPKSNLNEYELEYTCIQDSAGRRGRENINSGQRYVVRQTLKVLAEKGRENKYKGDL